MLLGIWLNYEKADKQTGNKYALLEKKISKENGLKCSPQLVGWQVIIRFREAVITF